MSIFPTESLMATDGSKEAELAATTVINLAKNTHSELHILTVGPGYSAYDVRIPEAAEERRRQAQEILDEQARKIEQAGGEVAQTHLRLAEGHPGFEHHSSDDVVRVAEEIGAGLIVLGSRGLGGMRQALMGSVSDSVVRHAHCPVLVVRGEPVSFPTKILVATDGSRESSLPLRPPPTLLGAPAQSYMSSAPFPALLTYTLTTKSASQKRPNACGVKLERNAKRF
jgi:nucleotide-binding universal stress UspA family protein